MAKGYFLENMSWPQVRDAFLDTTVVVVPTGSTEQHGEHLPVGTDWKVAKDLARRLGERANVIVTPVLPFGYAKYHTGFPGTLSLKEETLKHVLLDICEDLLKYGATHILFVNGHGGNENALRQCGEWLREKCVPITIASWWTMAHVGNPEWHMIGHADHIETAAVLALDENLVDMSKAENHANRDFGPGLPLDNLLVVRHKDAVMHVNGVMTDITDTGDMLEFGESGATNYDIDPKSATKEMGETILESLADYLAEYVEKFRKVKFAPIHENGPAAELRKKLTGDSKFR